MVRMKSAIQRIKDCSNDKERWVIVFGNLSLVKLMLDNDETYIMSNDGSEYAKFKNYIGNSLGICLLLEQLEVKYDLV